MQAGVQVKCVEKEEWRALTGGFLDYNYQQTWDYGVALAARRGATSEHMVVQRGGEVLGLADVRKKKLPLGIGGIAYISGGPLTRRGEPDDLDRLTLVLKALCDYYLSRRFILRILAPIGPLDWMEGARRCFESLGFGASDRTRFYRTFLLEIDGPEAEIRKRMEQKWRNCLNKAERMGAGVEATQDPSEFQRFVGLYDRFIGQKGFHVSLDAHFYASVQESMPQSERLVLSTVSQNGDIVAAHVSSMLGDTCLYLLGASCEAGNNLNASYLLQWQTILAARSRGMKYYDLGGIDPEAAPGVYHFKKGLGGQESYAPGPYERIPGGLSGRMIRGIEGALLKSRGVLRNVSRG